MVACKRCGFHPMVLLDENRCSQCGYDDDPFRFRDIYRGEWYLKCEITGRKCEDTGKCECLHCREYRRVQKFIHKKEWE